MFGKEKEKIEALRKENAELRDAVRALAIRVEAMERGYEPLFRHFLDGKQTASPNDARFFAPEHNFHPDEDYRR